MSVASLGRESLSVPGLRYVILTVTQSGHAVSSAFRKAGALSALQPVFRAVSRQPGQGAVVEGNTMEGVEVRNGAGTLLGHP